MKKCNCFICSYASFLHRNFLLHQLCHPLLYLVKKCLIQLLFSRHGKVKTASYRIMKHHFIYFFFACKIVNCLQKHQTCSSLIGFISNAVFCGDQLDFAVPFRFFVKLTDLAPCNYKNNRSRAGLFVLFYNFFIGNSHGKLSGFPIDCKFHCMIHKISFSDPKDQLG